MDFKKHLIKNPSAWLPIAMSVVAFVLVLSYASVFGVTKQQDEGVAARTFQLLLAGQLPIIGFFAVKWFPKKRKQAIQVIVLQFIAGLLAVATLLFLEH